MGGEAIMGYFSKMTQAKKKITNRTCPLDTNPEFERLVAEVVVQYDLYVVHPSKLHPVQHAQVVDVLSPVTGGQDQDDVAEPDFGLVQRGHRHVLTSHVTGAVHGSQSGGGVSRAV